MTIDNLFDVTMENVHMISVDSFEAATPPPARSEPMATEAQFSYMRDLFQQRQNNEEAQILRAHLLSEWRAGKLTRKMASEAIDDIKAIPRDATVSAASTLPIPASHGEIWVTTRGSFVRVKESQQTGNLYGLEWQGSNWVYTPGIMGVLDHKITAEEAAAWGHEHQWCVFCSRPLSDPRSEFAGYGETCARKNMLPWGETAQSVNEPTKEETEDVYEYPYGQGTCRVCLQPRPFVLNGYLRGCNC